MAVGEPFTRTDINHLPIIAEHCTARSTPCETADITKTMAALNSWFSYNLSVEEKERIRPTASLLFRFQEGKYSAFSEWIPTNSGITATLRFTSEYSADNPTISLDCVRDLVVNESIVTVAAHFSTESTSMTLTARDGDELSQLTLYDTGGVYVTGSFWEHSLENMKRIFPNTSLDTIKASRSVIDTSAYHYFRKLLFAPAVVEIQSMS